LRQIDGSQAMGTLQIATEMAAPPELRTPMGTAAGNRPAECGWKCGDSGAGVNRPEAKGDVRGKGTMRMTRTRGQRASGARMRRCLKLRQGASVE
jgi:hypothetical protein